jgi:hypothetical protein
VTGNQFPADQARLFRTSNDVSLPFDMKSKLTLRIDEEVKEAAKRLARERGESLSGLVEAYFRILTEHSDSQDEGEASTEGDKRSSSSEDLGPVTRRIAGAFGSGSEGSDHDSTKEADRRTVVEAARRKHK